MPQPGEAAVTEQHVRMDPAVDTLLDRIADEFSDRIGRGESIDVEEYAAQFPEIAEVIRQLFPALAELARTSHSVFGDGDDAERPARVIGDFRLIRQVGRGGMGIVYEAQQISLHRRVALKILPFAAVLDPRQLQRFKIEAQAAAGLHHPHIVPVHSVGSDRGVHYYAMQFVDGQDLATILKQTRLAMVEGEIAEIPAETRAAELRSSGDAADFDIVFDPGAGQPSAHLIEHGPGASTQPHAQETHRVHRLSTDSFGDKRHRYRTIAELGIQAAEALDFAHQRGIVHRDIKPSNLLIDAEGQLWVTDFGLAQMESETGLTMTGDFVGTLQYMSPEQVLGQGGIVDHRTDVYSLGVTLYELLTCRPMLPADDKAVLLKRIAYEDPPLPSSVDRSIPADLETIVLKAIAKDPSARYATAAALAEDLRHFLDLRPILAKRPGVLDRIAKWSRRNHTVVASIAVILLIAVVALSASTFFVAGAYDAESQQRKIAQSQTRRADVNLTLALQAVNDMLTEVASDEIANVPQMENVRRALMQKAVQFLEQLLADEGDVPAVRFEAAKAYMRITGLHEALGDFQQAEITGNRAIDMLNELVAADPQDRDYRIALTEAYRNIALSFFQRRPERIEDALATCQLRLVETQRLVDDFPDELEFRCQLAEVHTDLGNFHWEARHREESEVYLREAVRIWDELIAEHPEFADTANEAHSRQWLGGMLMRTSRDDEAESELLFANRVYELNLREQPDNAQLRGWLAQNRAYLGQLYFKTGDFARSSWYRKAATELRETLAQDFPDVYEHKRRLSICYEELVVALCQECRFDDAEALLLKQAALRKEILQKYPQIPRSPGSTAWPAYNFAEALYDAGRTQDARRHFANAIRQFDEDAEEFADRFKPHHWVSWVHTTCPFRDLCDPGRALLHAQRGLEFEPNNQDAVCVLGIAQFRCGDHHAAEKTLLHTVAVCDNDSYAAAQYVLAMIRAEQGAQDEARQRFHNAATWRTQRKAGDFYLVRLHHEAADRLQINAD